VPSAHSIGERVGAARGGAALAASGCGIRRRHRVPRSRPAGAAVGLGRTSRDRHPPGGGAV